MSILLKAEHVKKVFTMHQFGARQLVGCTDIDFELEKGDFLGITGRSGAGKSTILKCLYRTYLPTEGRILFESEQFGTVDIASASEQTIIALRKRELGYVSQFLNVLPRITALDVVAHALVETGCDPADADSQARKMLEHFQLSETLWDAYPNTFSGGEKLRLNLARAMVKRPRLLLLDEPTASLDAGSKQAVKEIILTLKEAGTSMVGIFHDLDFMESVVDRQLRMEQGRLIHGEAGVC